MVRFVIFLIYDVGMRYADVSCPCTTVLGQTRGEGFVSFVRNIREVACRVQYSTVQYAFLSMLCVLALFTFWSKACVLLCIGSSSAGTCSSHPQHYGSIGVFIELDRGSRPLHQSMRYTPSIWWCIIGHPGSQPSFMYLRDPVL